MKLLLVKVDAEQFALRECEKNNISATLLSDGVIEIHSEFPENSSVFCFPFWFLSDASELHTGLNSNGISEVSNWYCDSIRNERIEHKWSCFWLTCTENGFTSDFSKFDKLTSTLKKRVSRIAKLADNSYPQCDTTVSGLIIVNTKSPDKLIIARKARFFGQRRMKDDPAAPSRSYLKIEEAFSVFNNSPKAGDIVADLGAAPGGWTWAALKRGAQVYAIDNGPLKKGPLNHPNVHHIKKDAFIWHPDSSVDWLFCDMVEQPLKVLNRIKDWFSNRWCRYSIVNFKYGYSDPEKIIDLIYSSKGLVPYTQEILCRHLFHDRDEITVMARLKSS